LGKEDRFELLHVLLLQDVFLYFVWFVPQLLEALLGLVVAVLLSRMGEQLLLLQGE